MKKPFVNKHKSKLTKLISSITLGTILIFLLGNLRVKNYIFYVTCFWLFLVISLITLMDCEEDDDDGVEDEMWGGRGGILIFFYSDAKNYFGVYFYILFFILLLQF